MKAVILAGGRGTRICEETVLKPKPMVKIGEMPVLWHIMKIYSYYGIREFVICLGYKGEVIKEFFANYELRTGDVTFDFVNGKMEYHKKTHEPWKVTLVDTGLDTATGGRLKRIQEYVQGESFCFTYGDGLSDVNLHEVLPFHRSHGKWVTMTVCRHASRFGILKLSGDRAVEFEEKPVEQGSWMNSGFFVAESSFLDLIKGDRTVLEREPMDRLIRQGQLMAFKHHGFFRGMDSMRDRIELEELWNTHSAPWKKWGEKSEDMRLSGDWWGDHRTESSSGTEKEISGFPRHPA